MTRVTDRELELQAEVDRLCGTLFKLQQEKDRCAEENVTLRKAVALYEASDNLVIKNEVEVERLRAFARSKESNELAIAAELDEANAKLAKAREALDYYRCCCDCANPQAPHESTCVGERARRGLKEIS